MNVFLIRHTKVDVKAGICYGQSDVDVAESFIKDAESIQKQLEETCFDKIYSSPLKRCRKLSKFLFTSKIIFDDRLMEMNFGKWELQEWDKINPTEINPWMDDFVKTKCPEGESFVDLHERVKLFLNDLKNEQLHNVAIISHGGVIRSILAHINKEDLKDAFKRNIHFGEIIHTSI